MSAAASMCSRISGLPGAALVAKRSLYLTAAYNKYKDKGLVVLGIATWDDPQKTLKAIKDENIPYPQIINAKKTDTDLYGIAGIPHIILFAPDGTILARGLRGAEIDRKLQEIFAPGN